VAIFGDAGKSGAFTANRPGYQDLFAAAARQEFDTVIIEDGDRLSRKFHIMATAFSTLAEAGIELHSSTLGQWSLMHCAFAGLMSDAQRTRIFELTRSGIIKILGRNLWPGSAPFGYRKSPGKPGEMRKHPVEEAVVKRIYTLRASGLSFHQIYKILKKENQPSLCDRMEAIDRRVAGLPRVSLSSAPILDTPRTLRPFWNL
jgi:site-specific DNA recombinase